MKKTFLAVAIAFVSFFTQLKADDDTKQQLSPLLTAVPSLSIAPDARAGGMGDIGAATAPDINSQHWNPAKYVFMESNGGASISYTPWLAKLVNDIHLGYIAGYVKLDERQAVSASLRYFSLGDVTLTNPIGDKIADANPYELAVDLAYSLLLSENFSSAVALRYIRSDLTNGVSADGGMYPGNTGAADIAVYYKKPIEMQTGNANLAFGLNISNIGPKISYSDEVSNFIPTHFKLGGSFDYPIDEYNKISVSVDINKLLVPSIPRKAEGESDQDFKKRLNDYYETPVISGIFNSFSDAPGGFKEELREVMWSAGAEYSYNNQFFVRGGYFNESKYKGNRKYFTAGVGFKLNVLQIDAGYVISVAQTNPLDGTLRIGLSFDVFGLKNLMN